MVHLPKSGSRPRWWLAVGCVLVLMASGGMAQPALERAVPTGPVHLVIRPQSTTVRESMRADFRPPASTILLPDLPTGLDASTLRIMDRRREITLREIQPIGPVKSGPQRPMVFTPDNELATVTFSPESRAAVSVSGWQGRFEGNVAGSRTLEFVYRMTGVVWRAHYDVLVRGQLAEVTNPVSMDVKGWIEVDNPSGRSFTNVNLIVIGSGDSGAEVDVKSPGLLDLDDDSALADLWRELPGEPAVPYRYNVGQGLALPDGRSTLFSYVDVVRRQVLPLLVVRGGDIPTDTRLRGVEASLFITFPSEKDLPPGRAMIHVGQRNALFQEAWFKHTPARSEILIDMGKEPGVRTRRITRERTDRVDGGYEQVFELRIENNLSHPVPVHVDEAPLPNRTWTLLRASLPYDALDRRLLFKPVAPAKSETVIQYTLRVM